MSARHRGGTARLRAAARQLGWLSVLLACQSGLNAYGAPSDTPAPDNIERACSLVPRVTAYVARARRMTISRVSPANQQAISTSDS
jgi:hypothetical protein